MKGGGVLLLAAVLCAAAAVVRADDDDFTYVTCGSHVKLEHVASGFRLHSHEIPYGTGSRQQSVTAFPEPYDSNSYWIVRAPHGAARDCIAGTPVKCDEIVRLQHANTRRNLHSHLHQSPLTQQQEVSAFGEQGSGDTGDNWRVRCVDTHGSTYWRRDSTLRLQHVDTGKMLWSSANARYPQPIAGQLEVASSADERSHESLWRDKEGIFLPDPKKRVIGSS